MAGYLESIWPHTVTVGAVVGVVAVVLRFLAPRIWDLFKTRLEQWLRGEFFEPSDRKRLAEFRGALLSHLDTLDEDARWQRHRFVALDAEIDVIRGNRKQRRIMDLFSGIRAYRRARLFRVIGDPGSGKSVALRKLGRDMLAKPYRDRHTPIYINLREWSPVERWSKSKPPSEKDLREFLLHNVKERVSVGLHDFLDQWLLKLLDRGRLFLIFDSFDEIPAVMDSEEPSWLVQQLSEVIARTARSEAGGRAVLASRPFRQPPFTAGFHRPDPRRLHSDTPIFQLRPFSDLKIADALDHAAKDPDRPLWNPKGVKRALFGERPDLASIARTPFMLGLMIDFWKARPGDMPASQADLYESFVRRSLADTGETMRENSLDVEAVLACATAIAKEMFEIEDESLGKTENYGLDMPATTLAERLSDLPIEGAIAALRQARIARPSKSATFSFIHRRFHEYFLIDHFRRNPDSLRDAYEAIPHDTRWNDALVLYCEVADEPVAREIAGYCWAQICSAREVDAKVGSEAYRGALHSLRFLTTAFHARRHLLAGFATELADQIERNVRHPDMRIAQHMLEAAGVLPDDAAERTIVAALSSGNTWLMETAFRACRYLPAPSWRTRFLVMDRLLSIPPVEHLKTYREVMLTLRSAEGMRAAVWFYRLRHWDIIIFLSALLCLSLFVTILFALFPFYIIVFLFSLSFLLYIKYLLSKANYSLLAVLDNIIHITLDDVIRITHIFLVIFLLLLPIILSGAIIKNRYAINEILTFTNHGTIVYIVVGYAIMVTLMLRPFVIFTFINRFMLKTNFLIIDFSNFVINAKRESKSFIICFLFIPIIFYIVIPFMDKVMDKVKDRFSVLIPNIVSSIYVKIGAIVFFIVFLSSLLYNMIEERRSFQRALCPSSTRAQIHTCFLELNTERYRLKYVRWLEANCEPPHDEWPAGYPPNVGNDEASIELARLDTRWYGYDP